MAEKKAEKAEPTESAESAESEPTATSSIDGQIAAAVEAQQAVMAEESELSVAFKERKKAQQNIIDGLVARRAVETHLAGLTPEARNQLIDSLAKEN